MQETQTNTQQSHESDYTTSHNNPQTPHTSTLSDANKHTNTNTPYIITQHVPNKPHKHSQIQQQTNRTNNTHKQSQNRTHTPDTIAHQHTNKPHHLIKHTQQEII